MFYGQTKSTATDVMENYPEIIHRINDEVPTR